MPPFTENPDPTNTLLDPFTRGNAAIWAALLNSPAWIALVPSANQISVLLDTSQRRVLKGGRTAQDYKEFTVDQGGFVLSERMNSDVVGVVQTYVLSASSGVVQAVDLNWFKWVTFCAMFGSGAELNVPGFVLGVGYREGRDYPNTPQVTNNPARVGYTAIWQVDVHMYVGLDDVANWAGLGSVNTS